jgi:hypothetical protein
LAEKDDDIDLGEMKSCGSEHRRKRPSAKEKHQKGQARKAADYGGEKADRYRDFPRRRPKGWKKPWPP